MLTECTRSTTKPESTTITGESLMFRVTPEARRHGRDPWYLTGALSRRRRLPDGLDLRGLGDQALGRIVQTGLGGDRGAAAIQRDRHRADRSAADRPEQLAGGGDRGRGGPSAARGTSPALPRCRPGTSG